MGNSHSKIAPLTAQETRCASTEKHPGVRELSQERDKVVLPESVFHSMLTLERLRAERSSKVFVLMLLDAKLENGAAARILKQTVDAVLVTKRETDVVGWYAENDVLGVIFTEVNLEGNRPITETLQLRIETALIKHLGPERSANIAMSMNVFPDNWDKSRSRWVTNRKLYPNADLRRNDSRKRLPLIVGQ